MSILTKCFAPAAVALGLASAPFAASALTVAFDDLSNGVGIDATFTDNNGVGSVLVGAGNSPIGTYNLTAFSASAVDSPGQSTLSSVALDITGTAGSTDSLMIYVTQAGYNGAARAPDLSGLLFDLNGVQLGGDLQASAYYDNTNAPGAPSVPGSATQIGATMSFTNPGGASPFIYGDSQTDSAALSNPFSLTQVYTLGASTSRTQFDATLTATVPLPAAGLLLLGALGGLGAMRARRKS